VLFRVGLALFVKQNIFVDLSTALPAANALIVLVLEKVDVVIETKTVVIRIVSSETDTAQTKKGTALANAGVVTTINIVAEGMIEVIVIPVTDIVRPEAVRGIITVTGMIDATTIVVTNGDVKMAKKVLLMASAGGRTEIALPAMPGVRGRIAPGILTRGDATGTQTGDAGTREKPKE
jgi:hypothetical protein